MPVAADRFTDAFGRGRGRSVHGDGVGLAPRQRLSYVTDALAGGDPAPAWAWATGKPAPGQEPDMRAGQAAATEKLRSFLLAQACERAAVQLPWLFRALGGPELLPPVADLAANAARRAETASYDQLAEALHAGDALLADVQASFAQLAAAKAAELAAGCVRAEGLGGVRRLLGPARARQLAAAVRERTRGQANERALAREFQLTALGPKAMQALTEWAEEHREALRELPIPAVRTRLRDRLLELAYDAANLRAHD